MNKIICDVCGTSYLESAECCPICGCTRDEAILLGEEFSMEEQEMRSSVRSGQFAARKKKEIFDFDEVNADDQLGNRIEEVHCDEEEPAAEPRRHNTFAVIVLTVLIAVLLLLAGFLVIRYLLPEKVVINETEAATLPQVPQTTESVQEILIPCESLALTSGTAKLNTEGAFFLVNVSVYPENTTDPLLYHSADPSIATVDESGRITAVAEGNTIVYITCGTQQIPCDVVCSFTPETVPETEATEATAATEPAEQADEETTPETAPAEEQTPEEPAVKDVTLKLKKTDIILDVGYYFTLQLDCDLAPEEVEWSSGHPWVAKVDEKGVVTALTNATTVITAKYGDQEVTCTVRCR